MERRSPDILISAYSQPTVLQVPLTSETGREGSAVLLKGRSSVIGKYSSCPCRPTPLNVGKNEAIALMPVRHSRKD